MRRGRLIAISSAVLLAGCHSPAPKTAEPTDVQSLFKDVQTKFTAIPRPDQNASYDLRTPAGQASLKTALQPYNQVLDEAGTFLHFKTYDADFLPISDFKDPALPASQNASTARAAFTKSLIKALTSRARLELVGGQTDKGMKDFEVAVRIVHYTGEKPGSLVGYLVHVALQEIVDNALRATIQDSELPGSDAQSLGHFAAALPDDPDLSTIASAELELTKSSKTKDTKQVRQEVAEWTKIYEILAAKAQPAAIMHQLRAAAGKPPSDITATALQGASEFQYAAIAFETQRKAIANAYMTQIELDLLAVKDSKGSFPTELTGADQKPDPFNLNGALLGYRKSSGGFTLTSPGSKGLFPSLPTGNIVSLIYPSKAYRPARL